MSFNFRCSNSRLMGLLRNKLKCNSSFSLNCHILHALLREQQLNAFIQDLYTVKLIRY